ncbi:MAG: zinc-regulated TonB-dependent outer membrane receptor [Thioalkalivibrio sp.]
MTASSTPLLRRFSAAAAGLALVAPLASGAQTQDSVDLKLSLILEGIYFNELREGHRDPAGFGGHEHGDDHDHGHGDGYDEGFNMGHSELVIEGRLGEFMEGVLNLGFTDSDLEVEEAYLRTRSLPAGFQIKAGKFFSDVGYINSSHPHSWDFVDRPLVNEYLFGDHGLQEIGVQATWLAPTRTYTRLGLELLQGETSGVANYLGARDDVEGTARILEDTEGPRLITAFAKFAPDLGADHALQYGVSGGYARRFQETEEHSSRYEDWNGTAWFAGLDAIYKYDAGGSYGHGNWRLQSEYFYREIDVDRRDVSFDGLTVSNEQRFKNKQDGIYLQGVYGVAPRWEAGLRAEALGLSNEVGRGAGDSLDTSYRYSAMVTFRPIEPVFLRAQINHNDFAEEDGRERGLDFMLQLNVALGAHGAHRF